MRNGTGIGTGWGGEGKVFSFLFSFLSVLLSHRWVKLSSLLSLFPNRMCYYHILFFQTDSIMLFHVDLIMYYIVACQFDHILYFILFSWRVNFFHNRG